MIANGITYIQRAMKSENQEIYMMPKNITTVAAYLELLIERGIFVDLLKNKEVCDMTMAQFSRDDILIHQGREEGEMIGAIRTYKKLGVTLDDAKRYIMDEFQRSEKEAEELIQEYWR